MAPARIDFKGTTDEGAQKFATVEAALIAEGELLGLLLNDPPLAADCGLEPDDFHGWEVGTSHHALVYDALRQDVREGRETGLPVMQARFAAMLKTGVGDEHYLFNLWEKAANAALLPSLVRQIASAASQRRIARAVTRPGLQPDELQQVLQSEGRRLDTLDVRTKPLAAQAFEWVDPTHLPRREWLYDRHLIRRFVSTTVAPGGVGKSSLTLVEALAMTTALPLLGVRPHEPLRVWLINLEDPLEETQRRLAAACLHFGISPQAFAGRLFIASGRDAGLTIAKTTRGGVEVCTPCVRLLEREILAKQIDVLVVDPFVDCHEVSENDNGAINVVVKQWAGIADRTGCAVELVHHVKKPSGNGAETSVDDARGASALIGGVRSARVINAMSKDEAAEFGITERRLFFRVDNGKSNLAPPSSKAKWRHLVDVDLENGPVGLSDRVGVVTAWEPPSAFAGVTVAHTRQVQEMVNGGSYRENEQASAWVGQAVAEVLGWNLRDASEKARTKKLVRSWFASGVLKTEERIDPKKREAKSFVVVGEWVQP